MILELYLLPHERAHIARARQKPTSRGRKRGIQKRSHCRIVGDHSRTQRFFTAFQIQRQSASPESFDALLVTKFLRSATAELSMRPCVAMSLTRGLSAAGLASSAGSSATGKWYWNSKAALNEPPINRCDASSHRQRFSLKQASSAPHTESTDQTYFSRTFSKILFVVLRASKRIVEAAIAVKVRRRELVGPRVAPSSRGAANL